FHAIFTLLFVEAAILFSRDCQIDTMTPVTRKPYTWRIELLGGLRAISETTVASHFETRKAASLLAYLACRRGRAVPRETLAEMLWPDEDVDATRDRLRQALAAIRRAIEP